MRTATPAKLLDRASVWRAKLQHVVVEPSIVRERHRVLGRFIHTMAERPGQQEVRMS
jgi:hypothetical protein